MLYQCKRCGFSTHIKTHYIRHLEARKKPCKVKYLDIPIETLIDELEPKSSTNPLFLPPEPSFFPLNISTKLNDSSKVHKCEFCNKTFSRLDNLKRHVEKVCKEKDKKEKAKQEETDLIKQLMDQKDAEMAKKDEEIKLYKEEMTLMRKQIELLMTKIGNTNIETQNNNNTTNNITNIQINGWGEEDRTHLTDKFYRFCYDRPFTSIQRVIEAVFFNPNCPKNWNIMIKDDKSSKALVYNREKDAWLKKETNGVLEDLMHIGYSMLDENFDKQRDANKLTDRLIEKFTNFQDVYAKGDKQYEKRLATEIKELLINYKAYHIIKK